MSTRTAQTHNLIVTILHAPGPARWQAGDMITFEKADGLRWIVTILGREKSGEIQMMFYTGKPFFFMTTEDELAALRIVHIDTMNDETVTMYRRMLGLDARPILELEAA